MLQATSTAAAAAAELTVKSLSGDIKELHRENETLYKQLNDSRDSISERQQVDAVPLTSTASIGFGGMTTSKTWDWIRSSVGFADVSTTTSYADIPNGYRGLNWDDFGVMQGSYWPGTGYKYRTVSGDYVSRI